MSDAKFLHDVINSLGGEWHECHGQNSHDAIDALAARAQRAEQMAAALAEGVRTFLSESATVEYDWQKVEQARAALQAYEAATKDAP